MNSSKIQEAQNEICFLKIQYAARVSYNRAEKYNFLAWFACIVSAFSIFLPSALDESILNGIPFLFDFVAVVFYIKTCNNVKWGACLRKYFDAKVIGINPNQFSKSEEQSIIEKAENLFSQHNSDGWIQIGNTGRDNSPGVKDWYEFTKPLDGVDAQFECQRQNVWWNKKMTSRRIPISIIIGVCISIVFLFVIRVTNRSVLNTLLCSGGIILKICERVCENIKYIRISNQIDGSKKTIEVKPEWEHIEQLQLFIDERRAINVLESNSVHKKIAAKLSALYSKSA